MASKRKEGGKKSESSSGGSGTVSPIAIQTFLKGAVYPCNMQELVDLAKENEAPEEVIDILNEIDDRDYESPADVEREIGRLE